MDKVQTVKILMLGERGFPVAEATVPTNWVGDLPALLELVHQAQPDFTPADLARTIWRSGCRSVKRVVEQGARLSRDTSSASPVTVRTVEVAK